VGLGGRLGGKIWGGGRFRDGKKEEEKGEKEIRKEGGERKEEKRTKIK